MNDFHQPLLSRGIFDPSGGLEIADFDLVGEGQNKKTEVRYSYQRLEVFAERKRPGYVVRRHFIVIRDAIT